MARESLSILQEIGAKEEAAQVAQNIKRVEEMLQQQKQK
jgi:hypothetical protein